MQTVLLLSKIVIPEETLMGQLIDKVELAQFQDVKKFSTWLKSLGSNIENLLKNIVLLKFSPSLESHIDMIREWNGKECTTMVAIIVDLNE